MEKKNKNILSIVLLSLSLVGVVGAAAAITKGFSEFPDIVLGGSEEVITHVEENTSQQEETFEIVDVSEIYGKLHLKDIYGVSSKQIINLDSEKIGDDVILKYRTKTHDIFYDEEHDENLDLTEYKWALEVGYILKNGHVFKGTYGFDTNKNPSYTFTDTSIYGYYSEIVFSLNGTIPDNGLSVCSTTTTDKKSKIFVMSSENPELIKSYVDFTIDGAEIGYSCDGTDSYPIRPDYYCLTNVYDQLINISIAIEERRGGFYYDPVEYTFNKDIQNNLLQINNSDGEYCKMYFLLSCFEQTDVYLDELIGCFSLKNGDYNAYLYVYGQYKEPDPISEVPEEPGLYHITITNKQLGEYAVDSEVNFITIVRSETIPRTIQHVYFQLKGIKVSDGEEIIGSIANLDSSSRTNLSFRIGGSSLVPEEILVNEYDTQYQVMLNNSEDIVYEISLVIIEIENSDCFNTCFINNYEYFPNATDSLFYRQLEANGYYTLDFRNIFASKNLTFDSHYIISVIETDNNTINNLIQDLPGNDRYLESLSIDSNYNISLKFRNTEEPITGKVHIFSIFINETAYDLYPSIHYLDSSKNSIIVTERNDLKLQSETEYIIKFSYGSDLNNEQIIFTDCGAHGIVYAGDGNLDESSYFEEGDLMDFDGVFVDCSDNLYEIRFQGWFLSALITDLSPTRSSSRYCYLTIGQSSIAFASYQFSGNVSIYESGE